MITAIAVAGLVGPRAESAVAADESTQSADTVEQDPRQIALEETRDPSGSRSRQDRLISRRDRKRLERPIAFPLFGRELRLSGRITLDNQLEIDRLRRFDLRRPALERSRGRRPIDDEINLDQRIELDVFYTFTDNIAIYLAGQAEWENLVYSDFSSEVERSRLSRKEAWLYFGRLFNTPLGVQLGTQRFSDDREWWWDEDLDAVRVRYDGSSVTGSIAVAKQLLARDLARDRVDAEEDEILRLLADIDWEHSKNHVIAFRFLHHEDRSDGYQTGDCIISLPGGGPVSSFFQLGCIDPEREDESDAQLTWIGASVHGRFKANAFGKLNYWADLAGVSGRETFYDFAGPDAATNVGRRADLRRRHSVRGFAADLGLYWETNLPGRLTLIGGYAYGSGRPNDEKERQRGFRQTGLHDNSDKFRGVATFNYYGELFDPELANLEIWTAGVGIRFLSESSFDFVYHSYRQNEPAPFLRDVGFRRRPFGENRDVGDEFDLILGIEEWERFEIKAVFAVFRTGQAFSPGDDRASYLGNVRFRINF